MRICTSFTKTLSLTDATTSRMPGEMTSLSASENHHRGFRCSAAVNGTLPTMRASMILQKNSSCLHILPETGGQGNTFRSHGRCEAMILTSTPTSDTRSRLIRRMCLRTIHAEPTGTTSNGTGTIRQAIPILISRVSIPASMCG